MPPSCWGAVPSAALCATQPLSPRCLPKMEGIMSTRLAPRGTGVRQGQADVDTVTQQRQTLGGSHKRLHCDPKAFWVMG